MTEEEFIKRGLSLSPSANEPGLDLAPILYRIINRNHDASFLRELEILFRGSGHYINGLIANFRGVIEITQLKHPELEESVVTHLNKLHTLTKRGEYFAEQLRLYGLSFTTTSSAFSPKRELTRLINDARLSLGLSYPVITEVVSQASINVNHDVFEGCLKGLIKNADQAILAKAPRSPHLHIKVTESESDADLLSISITDNGEGMDEPTRTQAVLPFFSTRKSSQAVGLGLAIANNMVGQYKGKMTLESIPERGTTVTLSLPIQTN